MVLVALTVFCCYAPLSPQETSVAGLLSLLTGMLLHASPSCTPGEASPGLLPPNFVEAALRVMRTLCNVARLDLTAAQKLLSSTYNRVEFFHLIGFLLSYCTAQWPGGGGDGTAPSAADLLAAPPPQAAPQPTAAAAAGTAVASPKKGPAPGVPAAPAAHSNGAAANGAGSSTSYASKLLNGKPSAAAVPAAAATAAGRGAAARKPPPAAAAAGSSQQQQLHAHAAALAPAQRPLPPAPLAASGEALLVNALTGVAGHPTAELLNEVILLVGYFALLSPANQAILQWGKHPPILLRLCAVPFPYFWCGLQPR